MTACAVGRAFSGTQRRFGLDWEHPCPEPGWATIVIDGPDGGFEEYILCRYHFAASEGWLAEFESRPN